MIHFFPSIVHRTHEFPVQLVIDTVFNKTSAFKFLLKVKDSLDVGCRVDPLDIVPMLIGGSILDDVPELCQ